MLDISILFAFAFCAGMVDAVVGGGGLIQIPALINAFPNVPVATVFGTNKLASICGTSVAARTYIGKVQMHVILCCHIKTLPSGLIHRNERGCLV